MSDVVLPIPPAIRHHLVELLRLRWTGREEEPPVAALPASMPPGVVRTLAGGGPFGWLIQARLDVVDGRVVLEALEDDRMSGPSHYRVWDDGTVEPLPNERTGYAHAKDASPEEIEAALQAFYEHNHAVQAQLKERGFIG